MVGAEADCYWLVSWSVVWPAEQGHTGAAGVVDTCVDMISREHCLTHCTQVNMPARVCPSLADIFTLHYHNILLISNSLTSYHATKLNQIQLHHLLHLIALVLLVCQGVAVQTKLVLHCYSSQVVQCTRNNAWKSIFPF